MVLKRFVLIKDLKVLIQVQFLMYLGRSLQSFGAAVLKDLCPNLRCVQAQLIVG